MLILNLIISIILGIESKHIREELVNIKLAEEVEDFSKKTENITYITNGNAFNSKYGGNMTSTELSRKISDFMTGYLLSLHHNPQGVQFLVCSHIFVTACWFYFAKVHIFSEKASSHSLFYCIFKRFCKIEFTKYMNSVEQISKKVENIL